MSMEKPHTWDADDREFERNREALNEELSKHPGVVADRRWEELRRTVKLHFRNLRELTQLLHAAETNFELAIELVQNVREPTVLNEFTARLDQRLHNAISSAITLVDHSRRVVDKYEGTEFYRGFHSRNGRVKDDPRAKFIRRLRNYLLHYGNLPYIHNVTLPVRSEKEFSSSVQLSTSVLLSWGGWCAGSRSFLQDAGETVDLGEIVRWYQQKTVDLYEWMLSQFNSLHASDIESANALIDKYNELVFGVTPKGNT